jgi:hypothetical protein
VDVDLPRTPRADLVDDHGERFATTRLIARRFPTRERSEQSARFVTDLARCLLEQGLHVDSRTRLGTERAPVAEMMGGELPARVAIAGLGHVVGQRDHVDAALVVDDQRHWAFRRACCQCLDLVEGPLALDPADLGSVDSPTDLRGT